MKIAVLGATSKTGRYVVPALCERGHAVVAIGRDAGRLAAIDRRARTVQADITRGGELRAALAGAECVASLAHARYTAEILAALPASCRRIVLTGSLRKLTSLPDPAADAVRQGEAQFLASGRPGVMLHPSMIYGAPEERNVNRILGFLMRFPSWLPVPAPLPDGGRHTVQPVFVDDVVAAVVAAVELQGTDTLSIAVAGPAPLTYRNMVETCAAALGRRVLIVPLPLSLLSAATRLFQGLGLPPPFDARELTRATEDKSYDISGLKRTLGVTPRPFADGLATALARRSSRAIVDGQRSPD
jgi:nucleoside-diphosphate-sugar epimerase